MPTETFPIGDCVMCDLCGVDYTDSDNKGGLLLMSKAVCPVCAAQVEKDCKKYNETEHIRGRCPEGKSFAAWVREDLRGGAPAEIKVLSGDDAMRALGLSGSAEEDR